MNQQDPDQQFRRATSETADRWRQSLLAGQPVTTKLIVTTLAAHLEDPDVLADLARRALMGENALGALVRTLIQHEAEQTAKATIAAMLEAA